MSEFAFHPPDLSPSSSFAQRGDYGQQQRPGSSSAYPPSSSNYQPATAGSVGVAATEQQHDLNGFSRSPAPYEHLANGRSSEASRPGTAGDEAQRGTAGHQSRGVSPGGAGAVQQHPPPFGGYSFNPQHPGQPGANIRNTRPMTAPSSVSAPYFHGAMYSPHSSNVPASYYPGNGHFDSYQQPHPSPFQYQVDSGVAGLSHDGDSQRERGFSLPELVGIAPGVPGVDGGLPDDPRYSSGGSEGRGSPSSGPFLYAPPPRPFYDPSQPQTILHDPFGGSNSRPTTADSSRPTSSHQLRPHPGHAPPIPHGPTSAYVSRAVKSELHRDGAPPQQPGESKVYNFVASAGQTAKRPRRRYDEIERLYTCDYPGCQKAYGTLNHLNSHKTMQKHGPKSTPAQFKELRKAWRENKKRQAAEAARTAAAEASQNDALPLPANMHSVDRPRPSTSAGEYHYAVPAPFMTPLGAPVPLYAPQLHLPPPPPAGFLDPTGNGAPPGVYSNTFGVANPLGPPLMPAPGQQSLFASQPSYQASAARPVTAPNHYGAPAFGMGGLNGGGAPPLRQLAPTYGNGVAPQARRMSLPSELKQPTPVFGYGVPVGEEGFGSIEEESVEHGLGALGGAPHEEEVNGEEER